MTTTGCPDEEALVAMVEGALGESSLREIEAHVDRCERCAAVIGGLGALASAAARPRVVGRYRLDRRIATGGMGEVWAAWDPQLRREIAVKLVRPERADEGRERERLLREARALARLGHPNVLAVHDVGEIDGEVFIATELVVGDTLATRGGPTSDWRALARLYAQAARGLAAAHAVGLVHRDVKPANLLLGADGRVRVADFGLAVRSRATPSPIAETELAATDTAVSVTATGHIAGTPAYMAPEQRAGQPADARVDQFALCVALAEGISGSRPAAGLHREALIALVTERRTRELDLDRLCAVIAKGLARAPTARHADTNALADAIDAIVASSSGSIQPIPLTRSAPRPTPVRRHAASIAVIAVAASLGVVAVLVVARLAGGIASGSSAPPAERGSADAAAPHGSITPGGAGPAAPSPAGPTLIVSPIEAADHDADGSAGPTVGSAGPTVGSAGPAVGSGTAPRRTVRPPATRPAATKPKAKAKADADPNANANADADATDAVTPATPASTAPPTAPAAPSAADMMALTATLSDAQHALRRHDPRGCTTILARLPKVIPAGAEQSVELVRGMCEMLAGDCAGGRARLTRAYAGVSVVALTVQSMADIYCPITGDLDTRLRMLIAKINAFSDRGSHNVRWCTTLLAPARAAAREATSAHHRTRAGLALVRLATCIGSSGRCDQARALWDRAVDVDPALANATPDLSPQCP